MQDKRNLNDAEKLEALEADEKEYSKVLLYKLFMDYTDELQTNKELMEESKEAVTFFAEANHISTKSPLAMLYGGFVAGVNKGLELAETIESAAQEGANNEH